MKKILVVHNKYRNLGGEDIAVANEVALLKQYFKVEELYFENTIKNPIKQFSKARRKFVKIGERPEEFSKDVIVVKGSKGNTYTIEDGKCSCPGFTFRGNCKHVKEVA